MPKRVNRPWESRGIGRFTASTTCSTKNEDARASVHEKQTHSSSSSSSTSNDDNDIHDVPSIAVNGVIYYSDRFYLHRPRNSRRDKNNMNDPNDAAGGVPEHQTTQNNNNNNHHHRSTKCTCGSRQPPPLFDRAELLDSLDLQAAIVSTYTMDPDWMQHEFSSLFGTNSKIPTLILHGHKGFSIVPPQSTHMPDTTTTTKEEEEPVDQHYGNDTPSAVTTEQSQQPQQPQQPQPQTSAAQQPTTTTTTISCSDASKPLQKIQSTLQHRIESWNGNDIICIDDSSDDNDDDNNDDSCEKKQKQKEQPQNRTPQHSEHSTRRIMPDTIKSKNDAEYDDNNEDIPPEESWRNMEAPGSSNSQCFGRPNVNLQFPACVHFTEVLPTYLSNEAIRGRPKDTNDPPKVFIDQNEIGKMVGHNPNVDSSMKVTPQKDDLLSAPKFQGVHPYVVQHRKYLRGVHHPKFMILFETRGSIVVVVSTGNLTNPGSTDASWMQRFELDSSAAAPAEHSSGTTAPLKVSQEMRRDGSDFGYVLADYLQRQSDAAKETHVMPTEFLQYYLQMNTLTEFRRRYQFEASQVHLIATVPGQHRGRHSSKHLGRMGGGSKLRTYLYGPQRVADILTRLGEQPQQKITASKSTEKCKNALKEWLPNSILSDQDRLVIQQTSLGGNWKRTNLAELGRSYLACDDLQNQKDAASNITKDDELLERMDILWPTEEFMKDATTSSSFSFSSKKETIPPLFTSNSRDSPSMVSDIAKLQNHSTIGIINNEMTDSGLSHGNLLFLSSKTFNSIDLSCISRMALYEPSTPEQLSEVRPPHIKTYCRMFEGNDYLVRQTYNSGKAGEFFPWVLMSSACLSLGAQGKAVPHRGFESDEMTYSNFELGVLFCSRLQRNPCHDRLYCWKPSQCVCDRQSPTKHRRTEGASLVHLPFPFSLRPPSYQDDPEDANFVVTPFFHEVPQGTGSVGQMALTPLGNALASARH